MKCLIYTVYADGHVSEREFLPQHYAEVKREFLARVRMNLMPIKGGFIRTYEAGGERFEELMPRHIKGFIRYQQQEAA